MTGKLETSPRNIAVLTEALLKCESVENRNTRKLIVDNLPDPIKLTISREEEDKMDVAGIVNRCLDHDNGLASLISTVRYFEGNTIWMKKVISLLPDIFDPDVNAGRLFIASRRAPWIDQTQRELFHETKIRQHKRSPGDEE